MLEAAVALGDAAYVIAAHGSQVPAPEARRMGHDDPGAFVSLSRGLPVDFAGVDWTGVLPRAPRSDGRAPRARPMGHGGSRGTALRVARPAEGREVPPSNWDGSPGTPRTSADGTEPLHDSMNPRSESR